LVAGAVHAQVLQDYFTNRVTLTSLTGQLLQNNSNATFEVDEPRHAGKVGGHSLWLSWVATTNGIATFKTEASGFDTLLAVYQASDTNSTSFADLREVARADDSDGLERESKVRFGVVPGQRYEIAVDGYFGAVGQVALQWELEGLSGPPPLILNTLADRTVNLGDTVELSFNVTNAAAGDLKWYRNDTSLDHQNATNLVIANFGPADVGRYSLRIDVPDGDNFYSVPVHVQINTDGAVDALAQAKLLDAPGSPLLGEAGGALPGAGLRPLEGSGVVRGYNGTQIFSTTYAVTDTNEPVHCGIFGGKAYWLLYQPPANGTITLDTLGSSYDTVMETYTYNGTLTGYQDLISLDCANDSFPTNNAARIVLPVTASRQYLIAVDGVAGATGTAWLNYNLNTNLPPTPPTLTSNPPPQIVTTGATVVLTAPVTGAGPLVFKWWRNGVLLSGQTSANLLLNAGTNTGLGEYSFTATNDLGSVSGAFALKTVVPPTLTLVPISNGLQIQFHALAGQQYTLEETTDLRAGWTAWPGAFVGNGMTNLFNVANAGTKFYRLRVE
jgi:hypothetical protein